VLAAGRHVRMARATRVPRGWRRPFGLRVEPGAPLPNGLKLAGPFIIVNGSIAAAIRGEFGNAQFTQRTQASELFVNPLMSLYFAFDLMGIVRRSLYLDRLEHTETIFEVSAIIEAFRHE
jgi:hypothetical protein